MSVYLRIDQDQNRSVTNHPGWRDDTGALLSDVQLAEHNRYVVIDNPPTYDPKISSLTKSPINDWEIVDGTAVVGYSVDPLTAEEIAELEAIALSEMQANIDIERDRRIAGGMTFNGVRYQTRIEDRENVAGAAIMALAAMMQNAQPGNLRWHGGDSDFVWIAEDNSVTPMDAQTVFAFGQTMAAHKSGLIFKGRYLKDNCAVGTDITDDTLWA